MKISLCITTYNKPLQLRKVLSSILRMREFPYEVLVCDDGSSGETGEMLSSFLGRFPVPIRHLWQPDEGWQVAKVRNMGIREAEGEVFASRYSFDFHEIRFSHPNHRLRPPVFWP